MGRQCSEPPRHPSECRGRCQGFDLESSAWIRRAIHPHRYAAGSWFLVTLNPHHSITSTVMWKASWATTDASASGFRKMKNLGPSGIITAP